MLIKFPPTLSEYQERYLKGHIEDWCLSNGVVFADPEHPGKGRSVPVTVYPTPFSRHGFEDALAVQTAYNSLYHAVVRNPAFVIDELTRASGTLDTFTTQLLDIYRRTSAHRTQHLTGGLFRSDYIVDKARTSIEEGRQIKQVEFNTVSVSFGALATRVSQLHRYLAESGKSSVHGEVPESPALAQLTEGLAALHKAYCSQAPRRGENSEVSLILVIVQPHEQNIMDQRLLEYELYNAHGICCVRATLEQAHRKTSVDEHNRLIYLPNGLEISTVYYRSGYAPNDYASATEWAARERLEGSHAIQCPSVLTQLAGTKKMQQLLTNEDVVAKLKPSLSDDQLAQIRKTFVEIWPLDDSELGRKGRELAFDTPERFVLKPQREGGGNNVYREDIPAFLENMPQESWGAYVLMQLIEPPRISNKILKDSELVTGRIVSELGVFGTVLWDLETGKELRNTQAGFLLRTKMQSSDEGGVAAGFGCLDTVQLPSSR